MKPYPIARPRPVALAGRPPPLVVRLLEKCSRYRVSNAGSRCRHPRSEYRGRRHPPPGEAPRSPRYELRVAGGDGEACHFRLGIAGAFDAMFNTRSSQLGCVDQSWPDIGPQQERDRMVPSPSVRLSKRVVLLNQNIDVDRAWICKRLAAGQCPHETGGRSAAPVRRLRDRLELLPRPCRVAGQLPSCSRSRFPIMTVRRFFEIVGPTPPGSIANSLHFLRLAEAGPRPACASVLSSANARAGIALSPFGGRARPDPV